MKLPFTFSLQKKEKPEYFLALLLRDEKATAVIFEELNKNIKVIGESAEYFSGSIEEADNDEWLNVLDKTISKAEEKLPENIETQKTIFGLQESWITENHIKKDYLEKIKRISKSLDLVPIGFIVISEAIAHLLEIREGVPVSAILTQVGKQNITISLIRAGKIVFTKSEPIEDSVVKTADNLLHYFTEYGILPSRIILAAEETNEGLDQEFISHVWSKSLNFLHMPQISVLPKRFDAEAVLSGTATQMGFSILDKDETWDNKLSNQSAESKPDLTEQTEEETSIQDLGFVKEEDIILVKQEETRDQATKEDVSPRYSVEQNPGDNSSRKNAFTLPKSGLLCLKKFVSKTRLPALSIPRIKTLFIIPLILACVIAVFVLYILLAKAKVTLFIKPNITTQTQGITFSPNSPTDFSKEIIHAQNVSVSEDGSTSSPATGTKEIGDKAKGTITIRNISTDTVTLKSGTTITSSKNLDYTLDDSIEIASNSAQQSTAPTKDVSVTASDIGKEYNAPSGTEFTIGNNSSLGATNNDPFSGGSKQDITVVSKDDYDKLLADTTKSLEGKAKNDLMRKSPDTSAILPGFINETITNKSFNKNIGDQATSLTLKATVSYQGLSYNKMELKNFSLNLFNQRVQNEIVKTSGISFSLGNIKEEDNNTVSATVIAKAALLPQLDKQNLISRIEGKTIQDADSIILKLPQVQKATIDITPNLPFLPKVLPRIGKNIIISITSNE